MNPGTVAAPDEAERVARDHPDRTVLALVARGYTQSAFEVVQNPDRMTDHELAMLANGGEPLDFGYQTGVEHGRLHIYLLREDEA